MPMITSKTNTHYPMCLIFKDSELLVKAESSFELAEEDIIFNPSNVGFHPHYGLRLIDYGLKSDVF